MKVVYSNHPIQPQYFRQPSMFLAGPTPRSQSVKSWRPEAVQYLEEANFKGVVFVPEWSDFKSQIDYQAQVAWELEGLMKCTQIVFWVPRNLNDMPAFTTNVEFGRYTAIRNPMYGRPNDAPNNRYLDWLYNETQTGMPIFDDLKKMMYHAAHLTSTKYNESVSLSQLSEN